MEHRPTNKLKIFNDPIYGFVTIPHELIFDIIEHPFFQRLRRISQTGLSYLVYPGATHSRFHHALGCMHLMQKALATLKQKKVEISPEEELATYVAILLHDVGHGPFSHALENTIVEGLGHEKVSEHMMEELNDTFGGQLELANKIFQGNYEKPFLKQLISSQLDVDRLDYLKRDSFYTGVAEGNVNSDRIISMLNVQENEMVIDAKGVYSVEKYLIARMFMYWQVYLHKSSVAAEIYLIQTLKRAKELTQAGEKIQATDAVQYFLQRKSDRFDRADILAFQELDDAEIMASMKSWMKAKDPVLADLSESIMQRRLPKSIITKDKISSQFLRTKFEQVAKKYGEENVGHFIHETPLKVLPYDAEKQPIKLNYKDGTTLDILKTQHQIMMQSLINPTEKYHYCFPSFD